MKILVTGKDGQLGKCIQKRVSELKIAKEFSFVGRELLDLSQKKNIESFFKKNTFDLIINCAAYTQVDKAEEEANLANKINHLAVSQLARIAKKQKAKLIHISTDYVFDGESDIPYSENAEVNPINIYGKTKLLGERAIKKIMPFNAIIIRTSWLYSKYGNNFVKNIMTIGKNRDELNVVSDQIGSPTYAIDLANVILNIVKNKHYQNSNYASKIYHFSNQGSVSWYEFTKEIFKLSKLKCKVNPISSEEFSTLARRPKKTVLNINLIISKLNINPVYWKQSLKEFLIEEAV